MNVMVLTPYLPHARVGHGGGTAVRDLVRALARSHHVLVVSLLRPGEAGLETEVEALGAGVVTIPFLDRDARGADRLALLASRGAAWWRSRRSGYPLYVQKYHTPALAGRVLAAAEAFAPDAIQVEYLQTALLLRDLRAWRDARGGRRPQLVLNSHELGSLPRERRAAAAEDAGQRRRELAEAAAGAGCRSTPPAGPTPPSASPPRTTSCTRPWAAGICAPCRWGWTRPPWRRSGPRRPTGRRPTFSSPPTPTDPTAWPPNCW